MLQSDSLSPLPVTNKMLTISPVIFSSALIMDKLVLQSPSALRAVIELVDTPKMISAKHRADVHSIICFGDFF